MRLKNEVFRVEIEIGEVQDNIKVYESFREFVMLVVKAGASKKYEMAREEVEERMKEE